MPETHALRDPVAKERRKTLTIAILERPQRDTKLCTPHQTPRVILFYFMYTDDECRPTNENEDVAYCVLQVLLFVFFLGGGSKKEGYGGCCTSGSSCPAL